MFFVNEVRKYRSCGFTDNEISTHLRRLFNASEHLIEEAIEVADSLPLTKEVSRGIIID
jgi:hypothetical protein